ncbi:MAG: hypothetical protein ACOZF2_02420 [Thermodesulfobacteriota bacterium]
MTKDKEWLTEWAKRFYTAAIEFNSAVDECILTLFFIGDIAKQKLPDWEKRVEEKRFNFYNIIENVQLAELFLRTTGEFAPKCKNEVLMHASKIFSLLTSLLAHKDADIDEIRQLLFAFNKAAMAAHREILGKQR